MLLTAKRPTRVIGAYQKALDGADDFAVEAARSQIVLYQQLGIMSENVKAALSVFAPSPPKPAPRRRRTRESSCSRATGLMTRAARPALPGG